MIKRLITRITKAPYVRSAIAERADLSSIKIKPNRRIIIGLVVIAISYIIGWPAVSFFAILAAAMEKPLILIIGGPAIYGLSHIVFMLGAYLAGADHVKAFFRWLTRVSVEKLMVRFQVMAPVPEAEGPQNEP